jgi:hypothetical protein
MESYVQNDTSKMGIVNWKQVAKERDGWRRGTGERFILLEQWSHIRIRIRIWRRRGRHYNQLIILLDLPVRAKLEVLAPEL